MKPTPQVLRRLALLLGATTLCVSVWAQNQATLTPIGQWPEYPLLATPLAMKVAPPYAYLAGLASPPAPGQQMATLRLLTLDVSTPSQPRYLGHVDAATGLEGWSYTSIQVQGGFAYVLLGINEESSSATLAIFNIGQPAVPRLVGSCVGTWSQYGAGGGNGIAVAGNHVYVAAGRPGIGVIDVSDPAHPVVKPTAPAGMVATFTVSVSGNYLYASGGAGQWGGPTWAHVSVLDLSNPTRPPVVGGVDAPAGSDWPVVAAHGALLHLAYSGMKADPHVVGGYQVFDLSDPVNPSPLGLCELTVGEIPTTIRVAGNVA